VRGVHASARRVSRLGVVGTAGMTETVSLCFGTGGQSSVTLSLLVWAKMEGYRGIREPCGEPNGGPPRQRLGWACA
jgi:hypothetical protein